MSLFGLLAKVMYTGKNTFIRTLSSNLSGFCKRRPCTFQGRLIDQESEEGVLIWNFLKIPQRGGEKFVFFRNVVCFCIGYTSLSESSRRRSKLLPTVQTSVFQ